jgi:hypothetical protein
MVYLLSTCGVISSPNVTLIVCWSDWSSDGWIKETFSWRGHVGQNNNLKYRANRTVSVPYETWYSVCIEM